MRRARQSHPRPHAVKSQPIPASFSQALDHMHMYQRVHYFGEIRSETPVNAEIPRRGVIRVRKRGRGEEEEKGRGGGGRGLSRYLPTL